MAIFINGALASSLTGHANLMTSGSVVIGAYDGSYYHGLIDEVRIYSGALDAASIQQLYSQYVPDIISSSNGPNGVGCMSGTPIDGTTGDHSITCSCDGNYQDANCIVPKLFAQYSFDSTVLDTFGNSNGSCAGAACPTFVTGVNGKAAYFDGVSTTITLPSASAMQLRNAAFTITAWIKLSSVSLATYSAIIGHFSSKNALESLNAVIRADKLYLGFYFSDFSSSLSVPVGQWVHIAFRYSMVNSLQSVALNGVIQSSSLQSMPYDGAGVNNVTIGSWQSSGYFNGAIDDLRFYSGYLSDDQLRQVFIQFKPDTFDAYNGPNHLDCLNGGSRIDDVLLDNAYACNCSGTNFTGLFF